MVNEKNEAEQKFAFHYIKSKQFRVIHANGALGGITPNHEIHMALFNERNPIPKEICHKIEDGRLGEEITRDTKSGIIREIEIDAMMSLRTAKSLVKWLQEKIEQLEAFEEQYGVEGEKE